MVCVIDPISYIYISTSRHGVALEQTSFEGSSSKNTDDTNEEVMEVDPSLILGPIGNWGGFPSPQLYESPNDIIFRYDDSCVPNTAEGSP